MLTGKGLVRNFEKLSSKRDQNCDFLCDVIFVVSSYSSRVTFRSDPKAAVISRVT